MSRKAPSRINPGTKRPCATEHQEQVTLIQRIRYIYPWTYHVLMAIPNGGLRNQVVAAQLKAEGVLPGAPDVLLAVPRGGYHGLFIEMKRRYGSKVEAEQATVHAALIKQGYRVEVCKGADVAWEVVENYLKLGDGDGHD